jgi:hypothetical protein
LLARLLGQTSNACRKLPQKEPMALVVRTIGITRAQFKIGLANLAYNPRWFV